MTEEWTGNDQWQAKIQLPQNRFITSVAMTGSPAREFVAVFETERTDLRVQWTGVMEVDKPTAYPDPMRLKCTGYSLELLWRADRDSFWLWRSVGARKRRWTSDVPYYKRFRLMLQASKSRVWLRRPCRWSEFTTAQIRGVIFWIGRGELRSGISLAMNYERQEKIASTWNSSTLDELFLQFPFDDLVDDSAWAREVGAELAEFLGVQFDRTSIDKYREERMRANQRISRQ